jgi:hypothetical protein
MRKKSFVASKTNFDASTKLNNLEKKIVELSKEKE